MQNCISSLLEGICAWERGGRSLARREGRSSRGAAGDGGNRRPVGNNDDSGPLSHLMCHRRWEGSSGGASAVRE
jgi:hypothetical protein